MWLKLNKSKRVKLQPQTLHSVQTCTPFTHRNYPLQNLAVVIEMSSKEEKLLVAKQRLMQALGDNQHIYLANIKLWFRQKWTKEEFDTESRKLLGADKLHYHNQFFLALLNKVETLSQPQQSTTETLSTSKSSGKKRKRSSRPSDRATFEPVEVFDYLPDECPEIVRPPSTPGGSSPPPMMPQRFSVQELFLPDAGLVMGRLLVGAWETGLVSAEDNVSDVIVLAVQVKRVEFFRRNLYLLCAASRCC